MAYQIGRFGGIGAALAVILGVGCGDSGGGSASMSNSASQGDTSATDEPTGGPPTEGSGSNSMSATDSAEGGNSASQSGTTNAEGGNSESLSNSGGSSESISGSGTTGGETGMISGGGETSASTGASESTGAPIDCAAIVDEQECLQSGCMAIKGRQIIDDLAIACIEDAAVFIGCMAPMGCDDVITTVCKGDVMYQLPDSCAPAGLVPCEPPPDQGGDGYPACM